MNCDGVRALLSAYIDGELAGGELLRVEQHLRRCHWCADEVDALRQTIALVASLDEVEVPAAFHAQLHQRLVALGPPVQLARSAAQPRSKRPAFGRWAVPAAAAAALVIGVAGLNRLMPPGQVAQPPGHQAVAELPTGGEPDEAPGTGVAAPSGSSDQVNQPDPGSSSDVQTPSGAVVENPDSSGVADPGQAEPADSGAPPEPVTTTTTTPTGPTAPGDGVRTASYTEGVAAPADLPSQRQPMASLEATVPDPEARSAALKERYADAVNENTTVGIIRLQITVAADAFESTLAEVEKLVGAEAVEDGVELNSQLAETYQRIAALENERAALEARLEAEDDAEALEAGRQALQELEEKASQYLDEYERLLYQVEHGVITVTLKPEPAQ